MNPRFLSFKGGIMDVTYNCARRVCFWKWKGECLKKRETRCSVKCPDYLTIKQGWLLKDKHRRIRV